MAVQEQPQTGLDERVVENNELLTVLEKRQSAKERAGAVRKEYSEVDQRAKGMLAEFALEDGEIVRCGRFRIAKTAVPPRTVAFETNPTSRLTISALEEAA